MSEKWKWSFTEAFSVILATYVEDWGGSKKQRDALLEHTNISEINDANMTGLQSGEGRAVIFIHGSPANSMRWEHYLKNPPEGYQIIAIDRMGFGNRGNETPNLEDDYLKVKSFIQQFDKPIIVSHSLGGAHAMRLARENLITGLVLVASSINPLLERVMPIQKIGNSKFIRWILSRSIKHSNMEMLQLPEFMAQTEINKTKLDIPTHIVHAKDDYLVPFAQVDYARKQFNDLKITALEEGGHFIPWLQPDLVINAIRSVS